MAAPAYHTRHEDETRELGARLASRLAGGEIVLLCGDLGAGKTQFTKGIARGLGVRGEVVSPTFTMAARYAGRLPLVHYDLYRVTRASELREMGFLETDDPSEVAVVEWGDRVAPIATSIRVHFAVEPDGSRSITIEGLEL